MVSMLERSVLSHFRLCKKQAGITADYRSGETVIAANITVVPASRLAGVSNSEGLITLALNDDILIRVSDLNGHRPVGGDEIDWKNDDGQILQTNTVDRSPPHDFEDSYRRIYRVHTTVTGGEQPTTALTVFAVGGEVFAVNGVVFAAQVPIAE